MPLIIQSLATLVNDGGPRLLTNSNHSRFNLPQSRGWDLLPIFLSLQFSWLLACQGASSGSWHVAIPEGRYLVNTSPFCQSSGQPPHYPEPRFKSILYDFYPLVDHQIEVLGNRLTHYLAHQECLVSITRNIVENRWSRFTIGNQRSHTFEPAGCTIPLSFDGGELPHGAFSQVFSDSTEGGIDLTMEVTHDEDSSYFLATPPMQHLSNIWQPYGCQQLDQMVFTWHKAVD